MKHLKYIYMAMLCLPIFTACNNEEEMVTGDGNPVMTVGQVPAVHFADNLSVKVNCKDEGGIPLSTLKAALYYGEEMVKDTTIRTKTEGDYEVKLMAPFLKNVPDGKATLKLTLQNIHFTLKEQTVEVPITRPHYSYVTLVQPGANDTLRTRLTPDANNPFLFKGKVQSDYGQVNGYIEAPALGDNGNVVIFGQGSDGVTQGVKDNIAFVSYEGNTFDASFNVLDYTYAPMYDPAKPKNIVLLDDPNGKLNTYVGEFVTGRLYKFTGNDALNADDWYYDPDFFKRNDDGSFTFTAATTIYTVKADYKNKGIRVWGMADKENPATIQADGSGSLWIIGSDGIWKPQFSGIKGQSWWTDTDHATCMALVGTAKFQVTLTVGKQLTADGKNISFKFYGQPGWSPVEFKGSEGQQFRITTTNDVFAVGDGTTEYQGGKDDGNIYLRNGKTLKEGDTYVFTVDLTGGADKGVLTVTKK